MLGMLNIGLGNAAFAKNAKTENPAFKAQTQFKGFPFKYNANSSLSETVINNSNRCIEIVKHTIILDDGRTITYYEVKSC
jgi:hypothetical protein